jgi:ABC-type branched-subunit amino acid transport system ATPase component
MGLQAYAGKFVRELSTGTRRIVDLGGLLIQRPRVILFDEPSSGIAQREAEALGPLLRRIRDEAQASILVIEHDMPLLLGISDRLYALETGNVIAEGHPGDVVRDPHVVASYLGDDLSAIHRSGAVTGG